MSPVLAGRRAGHQSRGALASPRNVSWSPRASESGGTLATVDRTSIRKGGRPDRPSCLSTSYFVSPYPCAPTVRLQTDNRAQPSGQVPLPQTGHWAPERPMPPQFSMQASSLSQYQGKVGRCSAIACLSPMRRTASFRNMSTLPAGWCCPVPCEGVLARSSPVHPSPAEGDRNTQVWPMARSTDFFRKPETNLRPASAGPRPLHRSRDGPPKLCFTD